MNRLGPTKKVVFICGLHRSGTSVLHELLKAQNDISGFNNTGVPEDEGQFLQSVYKQAYHYGGPGKFGFNPHAALREDSALATPENQIKVFQEWSAYWDMSKPVLVEKSPPNLIKTRFLQYLFPNAYFIILFRHPVAVTGATKKWTNTSRYSIMKHWLVCHQIFKVDAPFLHNKLYITYEDMVEQPEYVCQQIESFLDVEVRYGGGLVNTNKYYFKHWKQKSWNPLTILERYRIEHEFEKEILKFGYSFKDVELIKESF